MPRRPELTRTTLLALVAVLATAVVLVDPVRGAGDAAVNAAASVWRAAFGNRPEPAFQRRMIVVLAAPSLADRVAAAKKQPSADDERRWVAEAEGAQRVLLLGLRDRGVDVRPELTFTRTFNGFSAVLDARALAELERAPGVAGVYPVRATYPASVSASALSSPAFGAGSGRRPDVSLPGFDGSGVTIALLDTGVARDHPYLHGHVLRGYDAVRGKAGAKPRRKPGEPTTLETHGTRLAGILVGADGPAGLQGVAPGASVLPIRVLGWRQARDGSYAVVGRGDELLAGLERAVDPDASGDVGDAARIALVGVTEPYAAFADSPEARAVDGAEKLGTVVVAPAGNDGTGGPGFGTVAGPAGAPSALAVGALDMRRDVEAARLRLDDGGLSLLGLGSQGAPTPLLGGVAPRGGIVLEVAGLFGPSLAHADRDASARAGGADLADFFDTKGVSRVANKAVVLTDDGSDLAAKVRNARAAGARAVLVAGTKLPPGALALDETTDIPVLALGADEGRAALRTLARGRALSATIDPARNVENDAAGSVVTFSSSGLAFGGRVKPDIVAAGVDVATADAGGSPGGERYATVTGTSAAAAIVAGSAALVAEARPNLSAGDLRSVLVGTAAEVAGSDGPSEAAGSGRLDVGAAATAQIAVEPTTLALGRASAPGWRAVRSLTVKNVASRALDVSFASVADAGATVVDFAAQPARFHLEPGATADVALVATASRLGDTTARGVLLVQAPGAPTMRVPWALGVRAAHPGLVGDVRLSTSEFAPSDAAPAVLAFRAGTISATDAATSVEPVGVLDLELWTAGGKRLGVLARLRDLLPGRYAFGLTGRGPDGEELAAGRYVIRLRARPADDEDGAAASVAKAAFTIVR